MNHDPALVSLVRIPQTPGTIVEQTFDGAKAFRIVSGAEHGASFALDARPDASPASIPCTYSATVPFTSGKVFFDFRSLDTGNAAEYAPLIVEVYRGPLNVYQGANPGDWQQATQFLDPLQGAAVAAGATTQIASTRALGLSIYRRRTTVFSVGRHWTGVIRGAGGFQVRHGVVIDGTNIIVGVIQSMTDVLGGSGEQFARLDDGWYLPEASGALFAASIPAITGVSDRMGRVAYLSPGFEHRLFITNQTGAPVLFYGRVGVRG